MRSFVVRSPLGPCPIRSKNLALNITDCDRASLVVAQWLERRFETLASSFTPHCMCLWNGPIYLESMPGEVKDPTQGVNVRPVVERKGDIQMLSRKGDIHMLEQVQRNFIRKIIGMEQLSYWEQLHALSMYSLER